MTRTNPFEREARNAKAEQLAAAILADGKTLADVDHATDAQWFRWWRAAGCASAPSPDTKALVLATMKLSAQCAAEIERSLKLFTGPKTFLPGEGSLYPIDAAERARLGKIEMCEPCKGTGVRERYFSDEGERIDDACSVCEGRGATSEGAAIGQVQ